jgi:beta-glucosidase
VEGVWPPGLKSLPEARKAMANLTSAYIAAYQEIKKIYKNNGLEAQVSLTQNLRVFSPCPNMNFGQNSLSAFVRSKVFNFSLLDHLAARHCLDFIGLNYYCREYDMFSDIAGKECGHAHRGRKNDCGWYVYPKGIHQCLKALKHYKLPIVISENGTAENQNEFYEDFLNLHLKEVWQAIQEGVDVRGYYWWSLMDNFEWDKGYSKKFGLFELDRKTFERRPRPFAQIYSRIAKENKL